MRCAIVSDIHANLQAWKAVLLDARSVGVDKIVCLGDIVGYGPDPAAVLQSVYENVDHLVLGNHDAVVCGKMDPSVFNSGALRIIEWTQSQLSPDAARFLTDLPLSLKTPFFRAAHANFYDPAGFEYIIDPPDAMPSWKAVDDRLLFTGHTHQPGIYLLGASGEPHRIDPRDFAVEPDKRYIVNVGSVGQPRDGEARACYCILDTDEPALFWRRIPFDLDAYRERLAQAGIDPKTSFFLGADPRHGVPALRDLLQFAPPAEAGKALHATRAVEDVDLLRRKVGRWKRLYGMSLALLLATGLTGGALAWRYATRTADRPPLDTSVLDGTDATIDRNLLPTPAATTTAPGHPLARWHVHLDRKRQQTVAVVNDAGRGATAFRLTSRSRHASMWIRSPTVRVKPGMKFTLQAFFRPAAGFDGDIAAAVSVRRRGENGNLDWDRFFLVKAPNMPRKGGWVEARQTFHLPADTVECHVEIRGAFRGRVHIRDISLIPRE